jgi:Putative Actinobacterial Holin-X, holin superfamily III
MTTTFDDQATVPGRSLSELLRGALADLRELGREYVALSGAKLKDGAKSLVVAVAALALAGVFAIAGLLEVIYGIIGFIVARNSILREQIQVTTTSGIVCLILAAIFAVVAYGFFRSAAKAPQSLVRTYKEDPLWQKTPV